jgi:hypothetical protein
MDRSHVLSNSRIAVCSLAIYDGPFHVAFELLRVLCTPWDADRHFAPGIAARPFRGPILDSGLARRPAHNPAFGNIARANQKPNGVMRSKQKAAPNVRITDFGEGLQTSLQLATATTPTMLAPT